MFEKEILQNQKKILNLEIVERQSNLEEIQEVLKLNKIFAFVWPRRAWKTFLTFQTVRKLIGKGDFDIESICYIDFSWVLDKNISLDDIKESYISLFPEKNPLFVFDEIQELSDFPTKLISILNEWYKVIITWSNAHMLSKELSTILRWKIYTKEIYPLDFKEYLDFKNISYSKNDLILDKSKYKNYFLDFLRWWGFPEVVLSKDDFVKENIIKNYFEIMFYKDLQDRYKIKNDFALNFLIKRLLSGFAKEININKIFKDLKSQNVKISKDSLYNFYEYMNNIYFILPLYNYWAQIKWNKKTYLMDVSFANLVWEKDFWKRFENFVYIKLLRKYKDVYFLSKNYEIDFFIPENDLYIQVVYELNYENFEREIKNLKKQKGKKYLIYFEKEDNLVLPNNIEFLSFDEFLFLTD